MPLPHPAPLRRLGSRLGAARGAGAWQQAYSGVGARRMHVPRSLAPLRRALRPQPSMRRGFFLRAWPARRDKQRLSASVSAAAIAGGLLLYSLYPSGVFSHAREKNWRSGEAAEAESRAGAGAAREAREEEEEEASAGSAAWFSFAQRFENVSVISDVEWGQLSDKVVGYIVPEWSRSIPGYLRKLQRELSMAPGSLADEIWQEAHDPLVNPEIRYSARVRVSDDLCPEEKEFLARRRRVAKAALARYLGLEEGEVHEDDVPVIALCGSGGGLRALVAGAGSLLATAEDGLFDCVTYTAGVSGSCWLQALVNSSIADGDLGRVLDHLKARLGVHIAYPPVAFSSLVSAPTNKYLLSGLVEKLKGNPDSDFGLVDVYGILLAARLLVPRGELGVNDRDFKLSNQRQYVKYGQNPLPIYTAVRHEIPGAAGAAGPKRLGSAGEDAKELARREAWFQWFEITPYEMFCEEFAAGIPTWAMGRRFRGGSDVPAEHGFHLPETRMPLLLGIFGSAFCATLSHYYKEVQPLMRSLAGFGSLDDVIASHNEDLSKVHPIDPATMPNFAYQMHGRLPRTTPAAVYDSEHLQLMDAGMSNNLPIYPLLRPGRNVDVIVAFDASADVRNDNWLSVADGYARQRGVKGWPVGVGWPRKSQPPEEVAQQLDEAQARGPGDARRKVAGAQAAQAARREGTLAPDGGGGGGAGAGAGADEAAGELGYCTVWVGTTQERSAEPPPPSKALDGGTAWRLMEPDAGIALAYLPFLANPAVPGADPGASEYMSTWNFVYTPAQVDAAVALARANYAEGRDQVRATVRAVYERKRRLRAERERRLRSERYRRLVRLGINDKLGEGDHFS